MKIKVLTKHFIYIKPAMMGKPAEIEYDREELFTFIFENNTLLLVGSGWKKSVQDMEECFKAIYSYFRGSNYHIKDVVGE